MEPSLTVKIAILAFTLATFVGFGIYFFFFGRRLKWPDGERLKRKTKKGAEVVTIIGPGVAKLFPGHGDKSRLADACRNAIDACFTTWNRYRPHDIAEESFDQFAVEFVTDEEIDRRAAAFWGVDEDGKPRQRVNGYMWTVKRQQWGEDIPLAVVRGSLWELVIAKGKPVVHEAVHALLGEFSTEGGNRDHTHEAWTVVWHPAEALYAERYRPAST